MRFITLPEPTQPGDSSQITQPIHKTAKQIFYREQIVVSNTSNSCSMESSQQQDYLDCSTPQRPLQVISTPRRGCTESLKLSMITLLQHVFMASLFMHSLLKYLSSSLSQIHSTGTY